MKEFYAGIGHQPLTSAFGRLSAACLFLLLLSHVASAQSQPSVVVSVRTQAGNTSPATKVVLIPAGAGGRRRSKPRPADEADYNAGVFTFKNVGNGKYYVAACIGVENIPVRELIEVRNSPKQVRLILPDAGDGDKQEITGKLRDNKGTGLPRHPAAAYAYDCEVAKAETNDRAEYYFKVPMPPEDYKVEVPSRRGSETASVMIELKGGRRVVNLILNDEGSQPRLIARSVPDDTVVTTYTPLTSGQKVQRAFKSAFLSPAPYALAAFNGGIRQIGEDRLPHKDTGDELADWGSQSARVFATGTTYRLFGNGFYPALFRQDPRYERSPKKGFGRRTLHAVSRLFVTRDDEGKHKPNYSRFAGAATSSALANVWERSTPGHDRIGADATARRFGMSFVSGAIGNIFREFSPDIFRLFRK